MVSQRINVAEARRNEMRKDAQLVNEGMIDDSSSCRTSICPLAALSSYFSLSMIHAPSQIRMVTICCLSVLLVVNAFVSVTGDEDGHRPSFHIHHDEITVSALISGEDDDLHRSVVR